MLPCDRVIQMDGAASCECVQFSDWVLLTWEEESEFLEQEQALPLAEEYCVYGAVEKTGAACFPGRGTV